LGSILRDEVGRRWVSEVTSYASAMEQDPAALGTIDLERAVNEYEVEIEVAPKASEPTPEPAATA